MRAWKGLRRVGKLGVGGCWSMVLVAQVEGENGTSQSISQV